MLFHQEILEAGITVQTQIMMQLAGDVSDDLEILHQTLSLLRDRWAHVFYTFGNHELWVRRGQQALYDSLGMMQLLICS